MGDAGPGSSPVPTNNVEHFERVPRTLIDGTSQRDAARRVTVDIEAMPTPADLVADFEAGTNA